MAMPKHRSCRQILVLTLALATWSCGGQSARRIEYGLVIHGGAGTITRGSLSPELESAYRAKLTAALQAGYAVLSTGGTALLAVEQALVVLEDSPLFNAGRGAVFTRAGTNELDASIMDGATLQAGAVAAVQGVKNPIRLARLVMDATPHVLLGGDGAEQFAREQGLPMMPAEYFFTQRRWDALQKAQGRGEPAREQGTVGAVALDQGGNLAAGTSTGGLTNKRPGRIGDSPIIGAGTYADNQTCAVSGTGQGEYFIRAVVAHDIGALMAYQGLTVVEAAREVVMEKLVALGGTGGVIALDREGHIAMPFNTAGMYRGYVDEAGRVEVAIYRD